MLQQQIWFLITEWLNTLNLNWRKSWAVSRLNIRWNHRERELVFSANICGFLTQKGSKTSQLKDTLKSLCPDKLFAVICQRNTQWSSAYSRMCSPNMSTNSPGTDSEEARVVPLLEMSRSSVLYRLFVTTAICSYYLINATGYLYSCQQLRCSVWKICHCTDCTAKKKKKNEDLALCKQHRERDVPAAGYYLTLSVWRWRNFWQKTTTFYLLFVFFVWMLELNCEEWCVHFEMLSAGGSGEEDRLLRHQIENTVLCFEGVHLHSC